MATATTQKQRLLTVKTPAGDDVLLVKSFNATERVSGLFDISVELMADRAKAAQIIPADLIGKKATLTVALEDDFSSGKVRYFNGVIKRFSVGGQDDRFSYFQMQLVPFAWLMTQTSHSRIYQNLSALDIIKKVLDELKANFASLVKYKPSTQRTYTKMDYCVQYRETDFNFISRLMEQEGIFYFFKHTAEEHELVLADNPSASSPCEEQSELRYLPEGGTDEPTKDVVLSWSSQREIRPGKYQYRDHHFQMPSKNFEVNEQTKLAVGDNDKLEVYDYPGEYAQRFNKPDDRLGDVEKEGQTLIKMRMEELDAAQQEVSGTSVCRTLVSGATFKLTKHPDGKQNKEYLLTSVQHTAVQNPSYVSDQSEAAVPYYNSFTCIPESVTYRAPRTTAKPVVEGLQSAVVVGSSGEEIWTDKYGRIRIQFHWDREGKKDQNSTCWCRVAQSWAGKQWGMHFWPRIGQEVIVAFMEGDPDQPIIVGSVYNAENMPPYEMPDGQTRCGVKSRSTKEGSPDNFNELRFEDKKDDEEIYFHAEKNFNRVVENDDTLKVGFEKKDKGDQTIEIFNNQVLKVGTSDSSDGSQTIEVYKNRTETVKTGDEKVTIDKGTRTVTVQGNDTHQIRQGNRDVKIDMGNDSLTIKMGNQTTKLNLGKSATEAMQSIELKVGQSSIKLDPMGVTIKGMMIKVEGQLMTDVKGLMTKVNGDAMLTVKGGLVMVN